MRKLYPVDDKGDKLMANHNQIMMTLKIYKRQMGSNDLLGQLRMKGSKDRNKMDKDGISDTVEEWLVRVKNIGGQFFLYLKYPSNENEDLIN